jgi:ABC-2 type transport system ATP-binding protein
MSDVVLRVDALAKTFRKPFTGAKVEAVRGISLEVKRGEIFGFLGPNGAGKTTTIKMLTGLIEPTSGTASIFGLSSRSPDAMAKVGFLPENPYVYPYLTPREFVTMCARLSGVGGAGLEARVESVIKRLGVGHAIDRAVRSFSKGMLQRVGIAAALVHDPELLVFDEPMSGLDPIGRKEVRDLIVEEKTRGRTVFFSSHILSDVEMLCDRVCILEKGAVALAGAVRDLVEHDSRRREIAIAGGSNDLGAALKAMGLAPTALGELVVVDVDGEAATRAVIERVYADGARIESVVPKRETLEALFMRRAASERPLAL